MRVVDERESSHAAHVGLIVTSHTDGWRCGRATEQTDGGRHIQVNTSRALPFSQYTLPSSTWKLPVPIDVLQWTHTKQWVWNVFFRAFIMSYGETEEIDWAWPTWFLTWRSLWAAWHPVRRVTCVHTSHQLSHPSHVFTNTNIQRFERDIFAKYFSYSLFSPLECVDGYAVWRLRRWFSQKIFRCGKGRIG